MTVVVATVVVAKAAAAARVVAVTAVAMVEEVTVWAGRGDTGVAAAGAREWRDFAHRRFPSSVCCLRWRIWCATATLAQHVYMQ